MASSSEDDMRSPSPDAPIHPAADMDRYDLFGSGSEDEEVTKVLLSDRELDSGDDEDRDDRTPQEADDEEIDYDAGRDARVLDATVWRHPLPKPADGEVRFKFPVFYFRADVYPVQHLAPTKVSRH